MVPEDEVVALNRVIVKLGVFLACCIETCDIFAFFRRTQTKNFCRLGVLCEHVLLNCFANPDPKRKLTFTCKCFRKELEQKREKSDFQLLETQRLLEQEKMTR